MYLEAFCVAVAALEMAVVAAETRPYLTVTPNYGYSHAPECGGARTWPARGTFAGNDYV